MKWRNKEQDKKQRRNNNVLLSANHMLMHMAKKFAFGEAKKKGYKLTTSPLKGVPTCNCLNATFTEKPRGYDSLGFFACH